MEAMILAAGHGTRLRPLTDDVPKALVEVGGVPMLERVARRLVDAGARRLIVNVSPHADKIRAFIAEKDGFGVEVRVSEEPDGPLETGGGLRRARSHFDGVHAPFLMHNVDLLTDLDVNGLLDAHREDALATLAVRAPESDRYLVFDDRGLLGYAYGGEEKTVREAEGEVRRWDFCGVQALSPRVFDVLDEKEKFSIINTYLRVAGEADGEGPRRIDAWDVGDAMWIDIGTHERLEEANRVVSGPVS